MIRNKVTKYPNLLKADVQNKDEQHKNGLVRELTEQRTCEEIIMCSATYGIEMRKQTKEKYISQNLSISRK